MKWNTGFLLVSPVGNTLPSTVKSKSCPAPSQLYYISVVFELVNMGLFLKDGLTSWLIWTRKTPNTWTFATQREGFSTVKPKRLSKSCLLIKNVAHFGVSGFENTVVLFLGPTAEWQPALHHGLSEVQLAKVRPLDPQPGEPATRLPSLWQRAGPRQRHGGETVIQAPGQPGPLTEHGQPERCKPQTAVQHGRVQTEELPRQRPGRRRHGLERFAQTHIWEGRRPDLQYSSSPRTTPNFSWHLSHWPVTTSNTFSKQLCDSWYKQ